MIRWLMSAVVVFTMAVGSAGTASAFGLDDLDPSEWLNECNLGRFFRAPIDGIINGNMFVGTPGDIMGGDCDVNEMELVDFQLDEINLRYASYTNITNGKMAVDARRRYGFDTNDNHAADAWTAWGKVWRWRNNRRGEYFKGYQTVSAKNTNGLLQMGVQGAPLANSASHTMAAHATPYVWAPSGFTRLQNVRFGGDLTGNSPYSVVSNGARIWHTGKNVKAKAVMNNGTANTRLVEVAAGQVWAKSMPRSGKRYQHIVYRKP